MSKALLSMLMTVVLLVSMMSTMLVPVATAEDVASVGTGDYTGDGVVDLFDAMMLMRYINGQIFLTSSQQQTMDVVADGKVDIYDVARLYAYGTGKFQNVGGVAEMRASSYATVTAQTLTSEKIIAAGEEIEIALTAQGLQQVLGMELRLSYDAKQLQFVGGEALVSDFSFSFNDAPVSVGASAGELWALAMSIQGVTVPDGEAVAILRFKTLTDIATDSPISFVKCNAASMSAVSEFYTEKSVGVDGGIVIRKPSETTTTTSPQSYVTYTIETVEHEGTVDKGETVELNISMSAAPDVNGVQLYLCYDNSKWEWVSGAFVGAVKSFAYTTITPNPRQPLTDKGEAWLTAMDMKKNVFKEDVVFATVTLKALCDITEDEEIGACYAQVSSYESTISGKIPTSDWVNGGVKIVEKPMDPSVFTVVSTQEVIFTDDKFAVDIVLDGKTGLSSFDMTVSFDSDVLTPVMNEDGEWATWNQNVLSDAEKVQLSSEYDDTTPNELLLSYISSAGNSAASGKIATVYFKLNTACLTENVSFVTADMSVFTDNAMCKDDKGNDRIVPCSFVSDTVTAYHPLTVEYYDYDNTLLESFVVANKGASTVIPEPSQTPAKWNYSFLGWNTVSSSNKVTKTAMFGYIIEVENGTIDSAFVNGQWIEEGTKAYFNTPNRNNILGYDSYAVIHANAAPDGLVFACWKDQYGNIVSYDETYTFFVPGNLKLTAEYATEAPVKTPTDAMQIVRGVYDPANGGSITWVCALNRGDLEEYTVLECGVIYGPGNDYETLRAETAGMTKRVPVNMVSKDSAQYSVTITGVASGRTRSAIGYAVYKDRTTGEKITVYSNNLLTLDMSESL